MARPVVYLDVDGVLNAFSLKHASKEWDDFTMHPKVRPTESPGYTDHPGFDLCMSKSMVAALAALPVDVMWLTTWEQDAPKHIAPLVDAPDWPVLEWTVEKGAALRQDQASNPRPYIWIDDYEATDANNFYWMNDLLVMKRMPFLLVRPDGYTGISRANMEDIVNFVEWLESLSHG